MGIVGGVSNACFLVVRRCGTLVQSLGWLATVGYGQQRRAGALGRLQQ